MPLALVALEEGALSPAVLAVAGSRVPSARRLEAAHGDVPLDPVDLLTALYQLTVSSDDTLGTVQTAALETAGKLPSVVLAAGLKELTQPLVLDFFAVRTTGQLDLLRQVLENPHTDNETWVTLARIGSRDDVVLMAGHTLRLLIHPPIVTALYLNRRTPMSTARKVIELAVKHEIEVPNLPMFAELREAFAAEQKQGIQSDDQAFADTLRQLTFEAEEAELAALDAQADLDDEDMDEGPGTEEAPGKVLAIRDRPMSEKLRLAMVGDSMTRSVLIRDSSRVIAMAAIRSPSMREDEVARYAGSRDLHEDVIRYISNQREWLRRYSVKQALVRNPKTPLQCSLQLIQHLQARDLRTIARSKSIPTALARAAKQLLEKRNS